ncbi:hypothetical protein PENSPDRAFT_664744 [Peniophora sp. CONT]|nr:hypothetical protein PENSPDRAFT_664744 [Peniophora sp. CONT]
MPGGNAIFIAIGALLQATKGVSRMYDAVEEALNRIKGFLERVQIHLQPSVPPSSAVMNVLIDTFVQVFVVITIVTKHCGIANEDKSGFKKALNTILLRANDFVRVLFDRTDVQDALAKLEKLATAELQAAVAHTYAMVRDLHDTNGMGTCWTLSCAGLTV